MTMTTVREDTSAMAIRPLTFEVTSESDPTQTYVVQLPYCPCKDFRYRRTQKINPFCKHLVRAFAEAGWHLPEATSKLTREEAKSLLLRHGAYNVHSINAVLTQARLRVGQRTITLSEGDALVEYDSEGRTYDVDLPA